MIPPFRREFDVARDPQAALFALNLYAPAPTAWTPALTFATPGDLSVAYTTQLGRYYKVGKLIHLWFNVITSSFTHTTASGNLQITGVPFTAGSAVNQLGTGSWGGITKANYTQVNPRLSTSTILFLASGSGVAISFVTAANTPTGGTMNLQGQVTYFGA